MTAPGGCTCGGTGAVILACSGAADVGELADQTARLLARDGYGSMSCLAGVGAGLEGMIKSAREAAPLLVIDGCPTACGKKAVEGAGITGFQYLMLTNVGFRKGATPMDEGTVKMAVAKAREILGNPGPAVGGCCGS